MQTRAPTTQVKSSLSPAFVLIMSSEWFLHLYVTQKIIIKRIFQDMGQLYETNVSVSVVKFYLNAPVIYGCCRELV